MYYVTEMFQGMKIQNLPVQVQLIPKMGMSFK